MASIVGDGLTCAVCFGHFEEPKQLVCGHTFCKKCLERIINSQSQLTCPLCRQITSIPHGDVEKLPTNITLKDISEGLRKKRGRFENADNIETTFTGERHHKKEDDTNIKTFDNKDQAYKHQGVNEKDRIFTAKDNFSKSERISQEKGTWKPSVLYKHIQDTLTDYIPKTAHDCKLANRWPERNLTSSEFYFQQTGLENAHMIEKYVSYYSLISFYI